MTRRALAAAASAAAALAATAPGALAATFTVTGAGDEPGETCTATSCPTLRSAITSANAVTGPDLIVFDDALGAATITVGRTLAVTDNLTIDGGGDITVAQAATTAGPLLAYAESAGGSGITSVTLAGPGAGSTPGTALVDTSASSMRIAGSTLEDAATSAVAIRDGAQGVTVTRNRIHGNGAKPVSFETAGVNAGITPPADLRVGPRRADGTLPVTGSTGTAGTLELFRGAESTFFFDGGVPGGPFAVLPSQEPSPGETIGATITDAAGNTSEYALTTVPADVTSPRLVGAVATGLDVIEVQFSEPVAADSVQPGDFDVQMANVTRTVTSAAVGGDGTRVTLVMAEPWDTAEAGLMRLTAPGAINDPSGNVSPEPVEIHVGGAPGDFIAPVITSFRLNPKRGVCFVLGPRCKRDRTAIIFRSSEDGDTFITVFRGSRLIGERRYTGQPGSNYLRFDGKIRGRRIKPGLYRMYVAMQDEVGNRLPLAEQPYAMFRVKSTKR